jgi:hypothetical protein
VKPSRTHREENYMDCVHGDTEVPDWPLSGGPEKNAYRADGTVNLPRWHAMFRGA